MLMGTSGSNIPKVDRQILFTQSSALTTTNSLVSGTTAEGQHIFLRGTGYVKKEPQLLITFSKRNNWIYSL